MSYIFAKFKDIIIMLAMLCVFCLFGITQSVVCYAEEPIKVVDFSSSNVLDDLKTTTVGGAPFDFSKYPHIVGADVRVLNFVEYCYGASDSSNYGLYVYVYNPSKINIDVSSAANKISISVVSSATDYVKYNLVFCNKSTGDFDNLFLKFKVADSSKIANLVTPSSREYKVSGIELFQNGAVNAADFSVALTYKYSGFAAGLDVDKNAASTLQCSVEELETVKLDVHHTYYRTGVSSLGAGHQNQVDSVYFSVPNDILKDYGYLQQVKAEWFEYRTQPSIVVKDKYLFDNTVGVVGQKMTAYTSAAPSFYINLRSVPSPGGYTPPLDFADWAFNPFEPYGKIDSVSKRIPLLFSGNKNSPSTIPIADCVIEKEEITEYIYRYNKSYESGKFQTRLHNNISNDLFLGASAIGANRTYGYNCKNIDLTDKFALPSYSENHNWWETFWEFGFQKPLLDDTYSPMAPIQEVSATELAASGASKKFLVNSGDVAKVSDYCVASEKADKKTFLLRFGNTDYYSCMLDCFFNRTRYESYMFQENVFLDFDIIELTFNKDCVLFVMPVVASPIDGIGPGTPPLPDIVKEYKFLYFLIPIGIIIIGASLSLFVLRGRR